MDLFTVIPAVLSGIAGLALIVFIVRALLTPLFGHTRFKLPKFNLQLKLKKKEKALLAVDKYIEDHNLPAALSALRNCFYLDPARFSREVIVQMSNHNTNVLARIILIAEKRGTKLEKLAIVEDLLSLRKELMEAYLDTFGSQRRIKSRRKAGGKELPAWGQGEFKKKLVAIQERLAVNKRTLTEQVDELVSALSNAGGSEEITYH